jgi:hypothetical protein
MASGTAASVKLYATGLQRPRVLTVKIELMSACGPLADTQVCASNVRFPKPFKWTKSADQILASVKRSQQTLCGEL